MVRNVKMKLKKRIVKVKDKIKQIKIKSLIKFTAQIGISLVIIIKMFILVLWELNTMGDSN